ncbi:hypothetical protein HDG35_003846 [Paraburkholderia sp. JPY681]|nr:hypothetical protein [Paraburkholderia atlantica]
MAACWDGEQRLLQSGVQVSRVSAFPFAWNMGFTLCDGDRSRQEYGPRHLEMRNV